MHFSFNFHSDDVSALPSVDEPPTIVDIEAHLEGVDTGNGMGLCVSMDPRAGYRWRTRHCDGRYRAQVLCQLPGTYAYVI